MSSFIDEKEQLQRAAQDIEAGQPRPSPWTDPDSQISNVRRIIRVVSQGLVAAILLTSFAKFLQPSFQTSWTISRVNPEQQFQSYLRSQLGEESYQTYKDCTSLPSLGPKAYIERRSKLSKTLKSLRTGGDIYISEPSPSGSYYANISMTEWNPSERSFLIVVAPGITDELLILTPKFEADRARLLSIPTDKNSNKVRFIEWKEEESPYNVLITALGFASFDSDSNSVEEKIKIHVDVATREFVVAGIKKELDARGLSKVEVGVADAEVLSIRERKTGEEIELLKCANKLTIGAIRMTKDRMYIGIKESETRRLLNNNFRAVGMPAAGGLILFGENAALPHGSGTDKVLGKNDLILIDAGGPYKGYVSDITRTFALPDTKVSSTQLRLWETVSLAQKAALKAGKVGASGREIDAAAREVVESRGTRDVERFGFSHRLGHGIGLEVHEAPYLVGSNDAPIQTGNSFSDEPGIYILGEVGVRLEDCWYVREDGVGELFTGPAESLWKP